MKILVSLVLLFLLFHSFIDVEDCALTTAPVDTATVSGGIVTLDCTTNTTTALIAWTFLPYGSTSVLNLVVNCALNPLYVSLYSLVSTTSGQCNLVIQTNTSVAGVYTCSSLFNSAQADLIILDSYPVMVTNATDGGTVAYNNEYVILVCQVNYTGSITPSMSWASAGGIALTNASTFNNSNSVLSYVEIPAYPNTAWNTYSCETSFSAPYPSFSYNISAPNLIVYYCPTAIGISPNGGQIGQGQILTCWVTGGIPAPSFEWVNLQTGAVTYGSSLALWVLGNYWYGCVATSPVCNLTTTANGTVYASSTSPPATSSTTAIIVGAVCGAVLVIVIVGLSIFAYIKCRRNEKKEKPSDANDDGISRNDYASDEQLERHMSGVQTRSTVRNEPHADYIRDVQAPPEPPRPVYRYPSNRHTPETSISVADSSVYSGHRSHYDEIEI